MEGTGGSAPLPPDPRRVPHRSFLPPLPPGRPPALPAPPGPRRGRSRAGRRREEPRREALPPPRPPCRCREPPPRRGFPPSPPALAGTHRFRHLPGGLGHGRSLLLRRWGSRRAPRWLLTGLRAAPLRPPRRKPRPGPPRCRPPPFGAGAPAPPPRLLQQGAARPGLRAPRGPAGPRRRGSGRPEGLCVPPPPQEPSLFPARGPAGGSGRGGQRQSPTWAGAGGFPAAPKLGAKNAPRKPRALRSVRVSGVTGTAGPC